MEAHRRSEPGSIAIFRALQLGDMLCAVPAFRALRKRWPRARISLVGLPWQREIVERFPEYLDELIVFPGYPGLPEQGHDLAALTAFLEEMNRRSFDLLLQMHGNGSVLNPLLALCGAKKIAGFSAPDAYRPDAGMFIDYPEDLHEIERLLALLRHLGIDGEPTLEFPISEDERLEFYRLANRHKLRAGGYACLHPGARDPVRRWSSENFSEVARHLLACGLQVVVTGTPAEARIAEQIVAATDGRVVNLVGETSLGMLAALIDNARVLVCNDTGVSHVAAARGTPSVVLFTASDPAHWAPLDQTLHLPAPPDLNHDVSRVLTLVNTVLARRDDKQAL